MHVYFQRHARRGVDPDDLLQECFLRVAKGIERVEDDARLGAWVQGIARHLALDTLRAGSSAQLEVEPVDSEGEATELQLDQIIGGWIRSRIEDMDTIDGEMLRAFELEGVSQSSIAERFQLSTTAVKSRIRRAREGIRRDILECCAIEFDRHGRVLDWRKRGKSECSSEGCG